MTPNRAKTLPVLSDDYYLNNFNALITFVHRHYEPLLTAEERQMFIDYTQLPEDSKRLFIRLISRSTEFIRCSKLNYPEIRDIPTALETLVGIDCVTGADDRSFSQWLPIFSKSEIAAVLPINSSDLQVPDLEAALFTNKDLFGSRPLDLLLANETVVQVNHRASLQTYRLLFFGNLHQDLTTFVLRDLGLRKFEHYLTDHIELPFTSRDQIDAWLLYYQCADNYEAAVTGGQEELINLYRQLPQAPADDPALTRRREKLGNKIARQLERLSALPEAAAIYRKITRPPARERLARITEKLGHREQAFEQCQSIEASPLSAEELEFAQQFSTRLAKKISVIYQPPEHSSPAQITLQLAASVLPVEFAAALHFAKSGKCYYVENSLITGILGLAIWDIIFTPLPGVFFHPFQIAPADFYEAEFYQLRQTLIERRLQEIENGKLTTYVLTHFHQKQGIGNPLVQWQHLDRHLITIALKRIPTEHWLAMFIHIFRDIRNHRGGLPDLIFFPDTGGYQLLEVKGPGDRLQKNQQRWMQQFSKNGIAHSVVHVEYDTEPTTSTDTSAR